MHGPFQKLSPETVVRTRGWVDIHDRLTLVSGQTGGESEETLMDHRRVGSGSVEIRRIGGLTFGIGVERHMEPDLAAALSLVGDLAEVGAGTKGNLHGLHPELIQP